MIIGLTGGSGTGKSCARKYFEENGFEVIDYDKVSRQVCYAKSPCLNEITDFFGKDILLPDGSLDRKKLGKIVFSDGEKLKRLNNITHKYILIETEQFLKHHEGKNIVLDAPLLFEAGVDKYCDKVISVIADRETRIKRIILRDNLDYVTAENRINSQKPDIFYIEKSDYIITNNSDIKSLENQTIKIIRSILNDSI